MLEKNSPTEEHLIALDDLADCLAEDIKRERKRIGGKERESDPFEIRVFKP